MRTHVIRAAAAFAALALAPLAHAAATPDVATKPARESCFASNNWKGWSTTADGDAIYLRVGINDIYRVDLTPGTHARRYPDNFLINQVRGSNWICGPLDLDLMISDHSGFRQPLIARSMRKLTATEIAAIPKKELP